MTIMTSLKEKIQSDFKKALKVKNKAEISTLRLLSAAILTREKEKRQKIAKTEQGLSEKELQEKSQLSDEEVLEVLSSEAKKRKEAIQEFEKGGRGDLVQKEKAELKILEKYLPEQLSDEELRDLVQNIIKETGASTLKDLGKVMAVLMPKIKGRADGSRVAKLVREILTKV
jgi:hypothetical protein